MGGLLDSKCYDTFFKLSFSDMYTYKLKEMPKLLSKKNKIVSAYNSNKIYIIGGSNENSNIVHL